MYEKYKEDYCEIIKEILCSEANISKCFDLLLNRIIVDWFDSIQDSQIKIKLLNDILSCYNERTNSLGELLYNYSDLIIILNQFSDVKKELNDNLEIDSDEYDQIHKYNSDLDV